MTFFDSEDDVVRHRVVVGQERPNKLTRFDPQGVSPSQVTGLRDTTSPVLELRNEGVIVGTHPFGQIALGQTASLAQLTQPASCFIAELLAQLGRSSRCTGMAHGASRVWLVERFHRLCGPPAVGARSADKTIEPTGWFEAPARS